MCHLNGIGKVSAVCALVSSLFLSPTWAEDVGPDARALEEAAVRSVNHFALQSARLLAQDGGDLFFSP